MGSSMGPVPTTSARLDLLLERRAAWRALRARRRASMALTGRCRSHRRQHELATGFVSTIGPTDVTGDVLRVLRVLS